MPHLTGKYGTSGPILDVWVNVSEPFSKYLRAQGRPQSTAQRLRFLIDTGADRTMVDTHALRCLALPERGAIDIVGSTTHIEPVTLPTFDIQLELRTFGYESRIFPALEIIGKPFFNVSIEGLLGRDVLDQMQLQIGQGRFRLDY